MQGERGKTQKEVDCKNVPGYKNIWYTEAIVA